MSPRGQGPVIGYHSAGGPPGDGSGPRRPRYTAGTEPERIAEHVWRLGSYCLPVFLVRGADGCALFEVGVSASAPAVLAQLAGLGVPAEEVRYLIISHAHSDHATGWAGLAAGLPRARVRMSGASQRHLAKPATWDEFADEDGYTARRLCGGGRDRRMDPGQVSPPSELVTTLEPGKGLDLGGASLRMLADKGHAPGGLAGWVPEDGVLLASDSAGFVSLGRPHFPMYFVSFQAYLDGLDEFAALGPAVLCPGHQGWFSGSGVTAWLDELRGHLEGERRHVLREIESGQTPEQAARGMFRRYYGRELTIYPPRSMLDACRLLVRRSLEAD